MNNVSLVNQIKEKQYFYILLPLFLVLCFLLQGPCFLLLFIFVKLNLLGCTPLTNQQCLIWSMATKFAVCLLFPEIGACCNTWHKKIALRIASSVPAGQPSSTEKRKADCWDAVRSGRQGIKKVSKVLQGHFRNEKDGCSVHPEGGECIAISDTHLCSGCNGLTGTVIQTEW